MDWKHVEEAWIYYRLYTDTFSVFLLKYTLYHNQIITIKFWRVLTIAYNTLNYWILDFLHRPVF
jgi:hypothetical protein